MTFHYLFFCSPSHSFVPKRLMTLFLRLWGNLSSSTFFCCLSSTSRAACNFLIIHLKWTFAEEAVLWRLAIFRLGRERKKTMESDAAEIPCQRSRMGERKQCEEFFWRFSIHTAGCRHVEFNAVLIQLETETQTQKIRTVGKSESETEKGCWTRVELFRFLTTLNYFNLLELILLKNFLSFLNFNSQWSSIFCLQ